MTQCNDVHSYGPWTPWAYYGMQLEVREHYCKGCPHTEAEYRDHAHDYRSHLDPHAPVGSGLTVDVCATCHEPRK